jgi:DNA-binding CsgD family transcriptional regulator/quercetin dioxygenase-like cupin family protein
MNTIELGAGAQVTILVRAEQTSGQCSAILGFAEAGISGPPPHSHAFTELYVMLEGHLELQRGDELLELGPGEVAVIPPGTVHAFTVCGEHPARWVNVWAPGGFEGYFEEAAAALPADVAPDPAVLAEIASRYGLQVDSEDTVAQSSAVAAHDRGELTAREREVVDLIVRGLRVKQIASLLCISRWTVTSHLSSIYAKKGVTSRGELAALVNHRAAPNLG